MEKLPQTRYEYMPHDRVVLRQRVFGITEEDVELIIKPHGANRRGGLGSMGSKYPDCCALFAPRACSLISSPSALREVTNPAAGFNSGKNITSMFTLLGAQSDVLNRMRRPHAVFI